MWFQLQPEWVLHDPVFASDALDPPRASGPWAGHRFFAYDLLRYRAPGRLVELGTHYGVSFFAFCQAVLDAGAGTELHAIDTWEGDPHAGEYGPEVLQVVRRILDTAYPGLSVTRHQSLFSDALGDFEDESVDLVHIDGYHSYEAAREDFETWLPKLAPNGIVLMHDVAPSTGYGSSQYWAELAAQHPSFAFDHSFGLGVVLPKGTDGWEYLLSDEMARWRRYYWARAHAALGERQHTDQTRMIDERDAVLAAQQERFADFETAMKDQAVMIDERDALLREQDGALHDHGVALAAQAMQIAELDRELALARRTLVNRASAMAHKAGTAARRMRPVAGRMAARVRARGHGAHDRDVRDLFDAGYYVATYPEALASGMDPLEHYLKVGRAAGYRPSPLFDPDWYLTTNPDVAAAGIEPLDHFLAHGGREGRDPSPLFDSSFYLSANPDVAASGQNPLLHYVRHGVAEGRFVSAEHRRRVVGSAMTGDLPRRQVASAMLVAPGAEGRPVPLQTVASWPGRLITFDLWDTLVARERPADAAKLATARRQWLAHRARLDPRFASPWDLMALRVRHEAALAAVHPAGEYTAVEALERVLTEAVPELEPPRARALATIDVAAEIEDEARTTYPIPEMWAVVDELLARAEPTGVEVLSDFYLPGAALATILERQGAPALPVRSSCDEGVSKRVDGGLYVRVREAHGVTADEHLHVGDNEDVDVAPQVRTGGTAVHVRLNASPYPGPGELGERGIDDCLDVLDAELAVQAATNVEQLTTSDVARRAVAAGTTTALFPTALVMAAVEHAVAHGYDRVHYLSREGSFLAAVHGAVAGIVAAPLPTPRAVHLEVSRRSTFAPSLDALDPDELMRMWRMYGDQSPRALLVSLGVDAEILEPAVRAHGLHLDAVVADVARSARIAAFLADPTVVHAVLQRAGEQRALLLDYLRQRTDLDNQRLLVVDVGWRGTIQDNLARLLPDHHLHGLYLGLFPFLNPQPGNTGKYGVAFDANLGHDHAFAEPPAAIERPWTPDVGSPTAYARAARLVVPVTDTEVQSPRAAAMVAGFQTAAVATAPHVARRLVSFGFTAEMLRAALGRRLARYYADPPAGASDIWFESGHDDTFGALNVTPFGKPRPSVAWLSTAMPMAAGAHAAKWSAGYETWMPVEAVAALRAMQAER